MSFRIAGAATTRCSAGFNPRYTTCRNTRGQFKQRSRSRETSASPDVPRPASQRPGPRTATHPTYVLAWSAAARYAGTHGGWGKPRKAHHHAPPARGLFFLIRIAKDRTHAEPYHGAAPRPAEDHPHCIDGPLGPRPCLIRAYPRHPRSNPSSAPKLIPNLAKSPGNPREIAKDRQSSAILDSWRPLQNSREMAKGRQSTAVFQ